MNLKLADDIDVLKHFIVNNAASMIKFDDENPNMFYGTITTGMIFGFREPSGFTYQTTFVDNTKLFTNQTEFVNAMKKEINLSDIREMIKFKKENNYEVFDKIPIPKHV